MKFDHRAVCGLWRVSTSTTPYLGACASPLVRDACGAGGCVGMRAEMWLCLPLLVARSAFCARCSVHPTFFTTPRLSVRIYSTPHLALRSGTGAKREKGFFSESEVSRDANRSSAARALPKVRSSPSRSPDHPWHLPPGEETRETKQKLELGRAHIRFSKFTSNTVTPHTHAREITHIYSIYRRATAAC